jgi:hypothetical protein
LDKESIWEEVLTKAQMEQWWYLVPTTDDPFVACPSLAGWGTLYHGNGGAAMNL